MGDKISVGIIFGGRSCEHEVSVSSARSVMEAMNAEKYDITLIGIKKSGQWVSSSDSHTLLHSSSVEGDIAVCMDHCSTRTLVFLDKNRKSEKVVDVIFPMLHGPYGEDGTIQGLLELSDIPYVGSGVTGSSVGMDKAMMRRVFCAEGLNQVDYLVVDRHRWETQPMEVIHEIQSRFIYPLFIKPVSMGSSVGVSKIHSEAELEHGMNEAASFDRKVMIEQAAPNCREIEVAVIGNEIPQSASTIGEVVPSTEFYDYDAKYRDNATQLIIPARISPDATTRVRNMAIHAFKAIDASGLSRVDFFVSRDNEDIFLNEINTMPGFTPASMYPKLWAASGVSYPDIIDRLIRLAIENHKTKHTIRVVL